MAKLINLEDKRITTQKVYKQTKEVVDNGTGEVTHSINAFIKKEKTKDKFIKLFVDNIAYLVENCSSNARTIFWVMLRSINYDNIFMYNSGFVDYFVSNKILSKTSVYRSLKELEEKKVIFRLKDADLENFDIGYGKAKNCFFVNPQIIGRGNFRDLEELRAISVKTFNFSTLEMKQEFYTETKYEGFDEISKNIDKYQITDIRNVRNEKNIKETEITIAEREEKSEEPENQKVEVLKSEPKDDNITNNPFQSFINKKVDFKNGIIAKIVSVGAIPYGNEILVSFDILEFNNTQTQGNFIKKFDNLVNFTAFLNEFCVK